MYIYVYDLLYGSYICMSILSSTQFLQIDLNDGTRLMGWVLVQFGIAIYSRLTEIVGLNQLIHRIHFKNKLFQNLWLISVG
jgi:hypothetical protein